jgi:uncharacterized membrane protein YsdA (DUF1294 family)
MIATGMRFSDLPPSSYGYAALFYFGMSFLTFFAYALDKYRAKHDLWRLPERTLHLLEAFGGWPGALVAQRLLHHKSRKKRYRAVLGLIILGHLGLWLGWMFR